MITPDTINDVRTKVLMVTFYPLIVMGDIGFVKNIYKDNGGLMRVTTTKNIEEAAVYGDEAFIILAWLRDKKNNFFVVNGDEELSTAFSIACTVEDKRNKPA